MYVGANPLIFLDPNGSERKEVPIPANVTYDYKDPQRPNVPSGMHDSAGNFWVWHDDVGDFVQQAWGAVDETTTGSKTTIRAATTDDAAGARDFARGLKACENDAAKCKEFWPDSYDSWLSRKQEESTAALGRRASDSGVSPRDQAASEKAIRLGELALIAIDLGVVERAPPTAEPTIEFSLPKTRQYLPDATLRATGRTSQVRQAIMEDIAAKELAGVKFTFKTEYNPLLKPMGIAKGGVGSQVGPLPFAASNPRTEVAGTMVHEELHQRWFTRGIPSPHHEGEMGRIFRSIMRRFGKRKGWPKSTGEGR
jgi:hypothetical protein